MSDLLRMDYINALPQPLWVRKVGEKEFHFPLFDIDVETGMLRTDVCGMLDVGHIADVAEFRDADGGIHDSETFYTDYVPHAVKAQQTT